MFRKKPKTSFPLFDCHTHLLPGLDDGSASWEEAIELALQAWESGTRALVLTPHYLPGSYEPSPATIRQKTMEFATRLAANIRVEVGACYDAEAAATAQSVDCCPGSMGEYAECRADASILHLFPGCEAYLAPELPDLLRRGELMTMGDYGKHLLVELPSSDLPAWTDRILFDLALAGVTPILAHPERCAGVRRRPQWLEEAVSRGVLVQVNGQSLTGGYGREVARVVLKFVRNNLTHFLGSDAHSHNRPAVLQDAVARLAQAAGEENTRRLTWENPASILPLRGYSV